MIIYTLNSFSGGSGQLIAQLPQHLATIPQHFLFSAFQLIIYFHKPVIFPDVVDFPSVSKFSAFNYHFPAQPNPRADSTFLSNCSKEHFSVSSNLTLPTGTQTSLQVEYNSHVLVGGIGSLLQVYFVSVSVNCYIHLSF